MGSHFLTPGWERQIRSCFRRFPTQNGKKSAPFQNGGRNPKNMYYFTNTENSIQEKRHDIYIRWKLPLQYQNLCYISPSRNSYCPKWYFWLLAKNVFSVHSKMIFWSNSYHNPQSRVISVFSCKSTSFNTNRWVRECFYLSPTTYSLSHSNTIKSDKVIPDIKWNNFINND